MKRVNDLRVMGWLGMAGVVLLTASGSLGLAAPVADGSLRGDGVTETARRLTLDDCLRIGLAEATAVRNAARDRSIADSTEGQIRARVYPQVTADASYTRLDRLDTVDFGSERLEVGQLDNYGAGVSVRQLLYAGGGVDAALDAAHEFNAIADLEVRRVRAATARRIRTQFADLLYLEAALDVHRQTVAQWAATLEQTEARFDREMASEFDVLNARVQLANARPMLQQASNRLAVARVAFADLLNLEDDDYRLEGELHFDPFDDDLDALLVAATGERPELAMARHGVRLREAEVAVERSEYRPQVNLSARYGGQQSPLDFGGGSDLEWRWSATVRAEWAWLDGGLRRHRVRQKRLERDKAMEDYDALRRAVALEVRQAWLEIQQAAETVQATVDTVDLAATSMAIAETRYRTGLITRLELSDVQMALMQAQLNHIEALRRHVHAVNAIRYAVGREDGSAF